jgi:transcription-repair coupling factor (superfamily II helicase)
MAEKLIRVAAQREIISTEKLLIPDEYYTFSKNFPFELTDDQETAINDIIADLETGKLMDRLICGDVGFGKTEVALRASFIVANAGYQVALVAPTTILVKQHFKSFFDRFKKSSLSIASLSRMTSLKDRKKIKDDLKSGNINVVIGTHALLSNDIDFNNLGLLIVDEEQHFGVGQKEKIKELQGNIHVLTLTATPIPRTLQLSLSGLKELSLITTPPINRLSVRTFVLEWDNVVLIDALLREKNRGGQTFVVCPRVRDIDDLYQKINRMVPNLVISVAHGQMKIDELDKSINSFSEGKSDILISTNIIESGIDIPNANTMIIHKSDMFGLSQLYQLRGRVGRGKHRAYSYFTIEPGKILLNKSQQRLDVIKTLDNLGAGFSLASYDMDIRGSGNLLGDEQSGQIKEVGVELYQDMLKEAVSSYKDSSKKIEEVWSPSISLGLSILIPEDYVFDLPTRMSLYRKAGELSSPEDINTFTEELFDRFGPPPEEVNNLLITLMIKNKCLYNKINIIDAGPKGVLLGFKNNFFNNADKLLGWVTKKSGQVKIRPDQKLFLQKTLNTREEKFNAVLSLIEELQLLNN